MKQKLELSTDDRQQAAAEIYRRHSRRFVERVIDEPDVDRDIAERLRTLVARFPRTEAA